MAVIRNQITVGTVLGGVDQPMQLDVRCPACGGPIGLEYHDVYGRWAAASPTPPTPPDRREFDEVRPLAPSETPLEMSCPNCARRVRVIVEGDEWRMSLWCFYVIDVLVLGP
jgi:hypothetical protein